MKTTVKIDNHNIGALSEFIDLLKGIQDEFLGQTVAISATDTDSRNMAASVATQHCLISLKVDYYNNILYIEFFNDDKENIQEIINFIKKNLPDQ